MLEENIFKVNSKKWWMFVLFMIYNVRYHDEIFIKSFLQSVYVFIKLKDFFLLEKLEINSSQFDIEYKAVIYFYF